METAAKSSESPDRQTRPVYISREWHRKLRKLAADRDVRVGILVQEALEAAFAEHQEKRKKQQ